MLIVTNLKEVIQADATKWARANQVSWPPNVPADQWWFQLLIDKGGKSTKVLLKHICVNRADTVQRCTVVGILDHVKDTYENLQLAFGELCAQMNAINSTDSRVNVAWRPRLSLNGQVLLRESDGGGWELEPRVSRYTSVPRREYPVSGAGFTH